MALRLLITSGDPDGIGPEIIVKALLKKTFSGAQILILGRLEDFQKQRGFRKLLQSKNISFESVAVAHAGRVTGAQVALAVLHRSVELLKAGQAEGVVTAPVSKERLKACGFGFPGHTEFFAHAFGVEDVVMMLFHEKLRVALVTVHEPLRRVFELLTVDRIMMTAKRLAESLQKDFAMSKPRIAVAGLNPHAGEQGLIGDEELKIIQPAIQKIQKTAWGKRAEWSGPHSSDVVFYQAIQKKFDAVLCHYHDQALIPLKTTGFETGVNATLGLPIVRTSPDHGTAFDIAGLNCADPTSLFMAIQAALKMIRCRSKTTRKKTL